MTGKRYFRLMKEKNLVQTMLDQILAKECTVHLSNWMGFTACPETSHNTKQTINTAILKIFIS